MNFVAIVSMIVLVIIDQWTKVWAVRTLGSGMDIYLWKNVFHLHYISNYGAAWGIFSGKQLFLIIITVLIILGMLCYMIRLPKTKWEKWYKASFVLIISGAIGNLMDRIALGYVRDFLYFILIDFPIFNVADILVVCGVGLLIVILFIGEHEEEKEV